MGTPLFLASTDWNALPLSRSLARARALTQAFVDANKAIELEPSNSKAYFRKGVACFSMEEYSTAKVAFEKGFEFDPKNAQFKTWIRKCNAEIGAATALYSAASLRACVSYVLVTAPISIASLRARVSHVLEYALTSLSLSLSLSL